MKARLLALLKLLLQVVLFVISGRWVPLGEERRDDRSGAESKRQRAKGARPPSLPRRRVFDARRPGPPSLSASRSEREQGFFSDTAAPWEALTRQEAHARPNQGRRAHAKGRARVATGAVAEERPRSLAATLRDPRALRESLAIGEALGPRRPPR